MSAAGRLRGLLATFAVPAGAWRRREPVLHNVLLTLVADRLSGDVPLAGDERLVRATTPMFERDRGGVVERPGVSGGGEGLLDGDA
ncbi:hypothetical protein OG400_31750 [Micromonospora ureilytica]|uniref:hypothetical protein n=1 Tax=Micromonospora ureilytica TaxID=709868 RepID=UPI002E0DC694|nr:hypothetical protein OG400_31750 [Micromonospora ureilytica]